MLLKPNLMNPYIFPSRLQEALIKSRPNRFIMKVELEGILYQCHCPVTGRIGCIRFEDIPCLISVGKEGRKTPFTVEAISLDHPETPNKQWIGINQVKMNDYVSFFLQENAFKKIFPFVKSLKREVKLGNSRIDFLINDTEYLEVKMPLQDIPCKDHPNNNRRNITPIQPARLIKHLSDTGDAIQEGCGSQFLLCYMYNAPPFKTPPPDAPRDERIVAAVRKAENRGTKNWQANFSINADGVNLIDYFPLHFF